MANKPVSLAKVQIRADFIREVLCDRLEGAIAYGIRRTFKHRDDTLPADVESALTEVILTQVENVLYDAFDLGQHEDDDDGK